LKGKTVDLKTDMLTNEPMPKKETTLDQMRGNDKVRGTDKQQERGGIEL
jgi:hypothetical protein